MLFASNCRITSIGGTSARSHTNNRIVNTSTLFRDTDIGGTFVIIITIYRGVSTSGTWITSIISARIAVIAIYFRIITSFCTRASIISTSIIIIAYYFFSVAS
jgi:hypothetical protein